MSLFDKAKEIGKRATEKASSAFQDALQKRLEKVSADNLKEMKRFLVVDHDGAFLHCQHCNEITRIARTSVATNVICVCGESTDTRKSIIDVDPAALYEIKERFDGPLLVDIFAPWCVPCILGFPSVQQLAENADGRWLVLRMNGELYHSLIQRWNVSAFPTMIRMDGEEITRVVGGKPLEKMIEFAISGQSSET